MHTTSSYCTPITRVVVCKLGSMHIMDTTLVVVVLHAQTVAMHILASILYIHTMHMHGLYIRARTLSRVNNKNRTLTLINM